MEMEVGMENLATPTTVCRGQAWAAGAHKALRIHKKFKMARIVRK